MGSARRTSHWTMASFVAAVTIFAVLAYLHYWLSDDALIVVRVARELLDGYGPNFNFFERAEANTSALWLWLVTLVHVVTRIELHHVTMLLGGVLAVSGYAGALDAARRLHRPRAVDAVIVPCGGLVVLGVFPFWDYATSGLETGLTFAWLSGAYWLLVTSRIETSRHRSLATAFVIGLGPLVRPDLALVTLPMLVALCLLLDVRGRRAAILVAVAFALPVVYEIVRAGYYGTLVPLPALAKSASGSAWSRGLPFIGRFIATHHLWLPLCAIGILGALHVRRTGPDRREQILIATPIVCGFALLLYVARVGGDFMYGRMLLAPTWLLVLPAMAIPLRRSTAPVLGLLACWAAFAGITLPDMPAPTRGWYREWDERLAYVEFTRHVHPSEPAQFVGVTPAVVTMERARASHSPPLLVWDGNGSYTYLEPTFDVDFALVGGRLGTAAATMTTDEIIVDILGLANPLGARITPTWPGRTGHEKLLPSPWVLAEYGHPDIIAQMPDAERAPVLAAKHAIECGDLAELLASVRDPMSPSRFWQNLVGAWARTRLVIPNDPVEAERVFCGLR